MTNVKMGVTSILTSRAFYAVNWYNISPALLPIGSTFGTSISTTSLTLSVFLVGAGIFQIPAGIMASRVGARITALAGLYLMGAASVLSFFSPTFLILVVSRFFVGVGAALFFSTAITLLNEIAPERITSMIGYYNASFNIGAGIGIIAFTPVVSLLGWRYDFLISGLIVLISAFFVQFTVNEQESSQSFDFSGLLRRLADARIWIIGIGLVGLWSLNYTLPEYFKAYATSIGISSFIAGTMGGMVPIAGAFGGMITGVFRRYNPIKFSAILVIAIGLAVAAISYSTGAVTWIIILSTGIISTLVISLEYAIVANIERSNRYMALNVGLINSIQIGIGSTIPFFFGFLIQLSSGSYVYSWIFLGAFAISTLGVLLGYRNFQAIPAAGAS